MKTTRSAWVSDPEVSETSKKPISLPDIPEPPQKSLKGIEDERKNRPLPSLQEPAMAEPMAQQEPPPAPMSMKEVATLMESAAKVLLDAATAMQKAHASLSKVRTMEGQSGKDKEVASKAMSYAEEIGKSKTQVESLAKEIGDYRSSLSKPKSPWLG